MKSMMIVDDDEKVIKGLMDHVPWTQLHIKVQDTAFNGEEALQKIKLNPPDILITDIYMPKIDGLELIEKLRNDYPSIYIIIHSGYDDFDNARRAMRFGVQHFFYKPSTVSEITDVMKEIMLEMEVQEKQQKLLENYNEKMKDYLSFTKDAFIRDLLITRYKPSSIPTEKLEMLQLTKNTPILVATLSLIRAPFLRKSKEREWQLMKFGSGNIIQELMDEHKVPSQFDLHVLDYSDTSFVLVFFGKQPNIDLNSISYHLTQKILQNILLYLKLSLSVGIGEMKTGVHEIINSYLESQRALEAAEYKEINKVFTFAEVHGKEEAETYQYPLSLLKEIHDTIQRKEFEQLLEIWGSFEKDVVDKQQIPIYIFQNICVSTVSAIMMENHSFQQLKEEPSRAIVTIQEIYTKSSTKELCAWMKGKLHEWLGQMNQELTSKKSSKLIRDVKEYVQNYFDQEFTLAEIADALFVNRNYLSQLFKRSTGESFVTYLNKFRIEKAKEILKENHYMIYEISEMVGYQNSTYFSQVFKSITGVSPSDYHSN